MEVIDDNQTCRHWSQQQPVLRQKKSSNRIWLTDCFCLLMIYPTRMAIMTQCQSSDYMCSSFCTIGLVVCFCLLHAFMSIWFIIPTHPLPLWRPACSFDLLNSTNHIIPIPIWIHLYEVDKAQDHLLYSGSDFALHSFRYTYIYIYIYIYIFMYISQSFVLPQETTIIQNFFEYTAKKSYNMSLVPSATPCHSTSTVMSD